MKFKRKEISVKKYLCYLSTCLENFPSPSNLLPFVNQWSLCVIVLVLMKFKLEKNQNWPDAQCNWNALVCCNSCRSSRGLIVRVQQYKSWMQNGIWVQIWLIWLWVQILCCRASQVAQVVKNLPASAGDTGSVPGLGRSFGGGHGNPLQYSCLENSCGERSVARYSPGGCKESDMIESKL